MKKFWAMKTYQEWWGYFQNEHYIGIDEEGIDQNYLDLTFDQIQSLINDPDIKFKDWTDRVFKEFCKWMQLDDYVIIGTGPMAEFNISGIVKIKSDYRFEEKKTPRHVRDIELLKVFEPTIALNRFIRTSRLELIDDDDFIDSIISLL